MHPQSWTLCSSLHYTSHLSSFGHVSFQDYTITVKFVWPLNTTIWLLLIKVQHKTSPCTCGPHAPLCGAFSTSTPVATGYCHSGSLHLRMCTHVLLAPRRACPEEDCIYQLVAPTCTARTCNGHSRPAMLHVCASLDLLHHLLDCCVVCIPSHLPCALSLAWHNLQAAV